MVIAVLILVVLGAFVFAAFAIAYDIQGREQTHRILRNVPVATMRGLSAAMRSDAPRRTAATASAAVISMPAAASRVAGGTAASAADDAVHATGGGVAWDRLPDAIDAGRKIFGSNGHEEVVVQGDLDGNGLADYAGIDVDADGLVDHELFGSEAADAVAESESLLDAGLDAIKEFFS